jgi:hypothetical protein
LQLSPDNGLPELAPAITISSRKCARGTAFLRKELVIGTLISPATSQH